MSGLKMEAWSCDGASERAGLRWWRFLSAGCLLDGGPVSLDIRTPFDWGGLSRTCRDRAGGLWRKELLRGQTRAWHQGFFCFLPQTL